MSAYDEYLICKDRGHQKDGTVTGWENYAEFTCAKCGTHFYFTDPKLIEIKNTIPKATP